MSLVDSNCQSVGELAVLTTRKLRMLFWAY